MATMTVVMFVVKTTLKRTLHRSTVTEKIWKKKSNNTNDLWPICIFICNHFVGFYYMALKVPKLTKIMDINSWKVPKHT